jgi:hypothetical protein
VSISRFNRCSAIVSTAPYNSAVRFKDRIRRRTFPHFMILDTDANVFKSVEQASAEASAQFVQGLDDFA